MITTIQSISYTIMHDPQIPGVLKSSYVWFTVDVLAALKQNDLVGLTCIFITTVYSVISWGIIAYKYLYLRFAREQTRIFLERVMSGKGSLAHAYTLAGKYPDSPLSQVLRDTYTEMEVENWFQDEKALSIDARMVMAKETVEHVLEVTVVNEIRHLESGLPFLVSTYNICPLVGLFGTVWGILGAFQVVSREGSAAIGSLAPGVSTALLTTVAGLIAAIPAVIAYNYFLNIVQELVRRMDQFGSEVANIMQKNVLKRCSRG